MAPPIRGPPRPKRKIEQVDMSGPPYLFRDIENGI